MKNVMNRWQLLYPGVTVVSSLLEVVLPGNRALKVPVGVYRLVVNLAAALDSVRIEVFGFCWDSVMIENRIAAAQEMRVYKITIFGDTKEKFRITLGGTAKAIIERDVSDMLISEYGSGFDVYSGSTPIL